MFELVCAVICLSIPILILLDTIKKELQISIIHVNGIITIIDKSK